jgi:hypothetical protein
MREKVENDEVDFAMFVRALDAFNPSAKPQVMSCRAAFEFGISLWNGYKLVPISVIGFERH